MPRDFLTRYSLERLEQIPRYMEALRLRIERGAYNPTKDKSKADQVSPFIQALKNLRNKTPADSPSEQKAAVEEFRWMVEEFKVSLFAPEIKTAHPISAKRLLAKLKELQTSISD
jgi:ATP-dependent helicase HrpA